VSDSSTAPPNPPKDDIPARELSRKERTLAGVPGILAAAAGGYSVFVSDNQAGTAALMLFAALFLLMAVQGTPLKRMAKDSFELERRTPPGVVAEKALEKSGAGDSDQAQAYIEGAADANPAIASAPVVQDASALVYVERVSQALDRVITVDHEILSSNKPHRRFENFRYADLLVRDRTHPDAPPVAVYW
jgi:hypothetical protein